MISEILTTLGYALIVLLMGIGFVLLVGGAYVVAYVWLGSHIAAGTVSVGMFAYWANEVRDTLEAL